MQETTERRTFLRWVIRGSAAVIGAVTLIPGLGMALSPILNRTPSRRRRVLFQDAAGAKTDTFVPARYEDQEETVPGVFVQRQAQGTPLVLSAACPHAGCAVEWHQDKHQFVCPCHQGVFDATGKNISGPPPGPLVRIPAQIVKGDIYIEEPEA